MPLRSVQYPEPKVLAQRYLARCASRLGVSESPVGSNRGPDLDPFLRTTDWTPGAPWCVAECNACGVAEFGQAWPLPRSASTNVVGDFALAHGILFGTEALYEALVAKGALNATRTPKDVFCAPPIAGDLYLLYSLTITNPIRPHERGAYHHAGAVENVHEHVVDVLDGNTVPENARDQSIAAQREGYTKARRHRALTLPLGFVRWAALYRGG